MRVLVSYNLVQALWLNRAGLVEYADQLWQLMRSGQIQGYITQKGLDIIHFDLIYLLGDDKAEKEVVDIKEVVEVFPIDPSIIEQALSYNLRDFESEVELACAIHMHLDAIVTQHPQNFDGSLFLVLSVTELLAQIEREEHINRLNSTFYQATSLDSSQIHPSELVESEFLSKDRRSLDYKIRNSIDTVLKVFEILKGEVNKGINRKDLALKSELSETTINSVVWDLQNFYMAFRQEDKIVAPQYLLNYGEKEITDYLAKTLKKHIVAQKIYEQLESKSKVIYRDGLQELLANLFSNEKPVSHKSLSDYTSRMLGWFLYTGLLEYRDTGRKMIAIPIGEGRQKGKLREETEAQQLELLPKDWQINTQVLSSIKNEITAPEVLVDDGVEVSVTTQNTLAHSPRSAIDLLDELPGQRLFKTPEEADQYLQEERSAWES